MAGIKTRNAREKLDKKADKFFFPLVRLRNLVCRGIKRNESKTPIIIELR
jgi:hypothetical protein